MVPPEGRDHKIPIGAEGDCALEKLTREGERGERVKKRKNGTKYERRRKCKEARTKVSRDGREKECGGGERGRGVWICERDEGRKRMHSEDDKSRARDEMQDRREIPRKE